MGSSIIKKLSCILLSIILITSQLLVSFSKDDLAINGKEQKIDLVENSFDLESNLNIEENTEDEEVEELSENIDDTFENQNKKDEQVIEEELDNVNSDENINIKETIENEENLYEDFCDTENEINIEDDNDDIGDSVNIENGIEETIENEEDEELKEEYFDTENIEEENTDEFSKDKQFDNEELKNQNDGHIDTNSDENIVNEENNTEENTEDEEVEEPKENFNDIENIEKDTENEEENKSNGNIDDTFENQNKEDEQFKETETLNKNIENEETEELSEEVSVTEKIEEENIEENQEDENKENDNAKIVDKEENNLVVDNKQILKSEVASISNATNEEDVYVDPPYQVFRMEKLPKINKATKNEEDNIISGSIILLIDGGTENLLKEIEESNVKNKSKLLQVIENSRLITVFDEDEHEEIVEVNVSNEDYFIEIIKKFKCVEQVEKNKKVEPASIITNIDMIEDLTYTQYSSRDEDETGFALFDKMDRTNFGGMRVDNWDNYSGNIPNPIVSPHDVVVAIIDTGCDVNHPDLKNVLYDMSGYTELNAKYGSGKYGYNAAAFEAGNLDKTDEMFDDVGHGTHCAGIIAAEWNKHGVSGVASGVKILPIKFNQMISIYKAFSYLVDAKKAGVPIIVSSNSWASYANNLIIERYVKKLGEMGVVTLFASGNSEFDYDSTNGSDIGYALGNPYKILVNASESSGMPVLKDTVGSWGSNYGLRSTDLYAPGNNVASTYPIDMSTPDLLFESIKGFEYEPGKYMEECFDGGSDVAGQETGYVKDNYLYKGDNFDIRLLCTDGTTPKLETDAKDAIKQLGYYEDGQWLGTDERKTGGLKIDYSGAERLDLRNLVIEDKNNILNLENKYLSFLVKFENYNINNPAVFLFMAVAVDETGAGHEIQGALPTTPTNYYGWSTVSFDLRNMDSSTLDGGKKLGILIMGISGGGNFPNLLIDKVSLVEDVLPYKFISGTSMACPNAAGVVANVYSKYLENGYSISSNTASKVVATVMSTTRPLEEKYKDLCRTDGIIDLRNALNIIEDSSKETPYIRTVEEFYQSDGSIKLDIRGEFLDKVDALYLSKLKHFNINTSYKITNFTSIDGEETTHIIVNIDKNDVNKVEFGEVEARVVNANGWTRTFFVHDKQKINLFKDIEISNIDDLGGKYMYYSMFSLNKKNYMILFNTINDNILTTHEYNIVEIKPDGENQCKFEEVYEYDMNGDIYTSTVYNKKLLCFTKEKDETLKMSEIDLEKKNCVIKKINTKYKDASDFYLLNTGKYLLMLYLYKDLIDYTDVYLSFLEDNGTNGFSDGKVYKLNNIVTNLFVDNKNNIYGYNKTDTKSIDTNIIKFSIDGNNELKEEIKKITLNDSGIKQNQEFNKCILNLDDKFVVLGPVVVDKTTDEILCDNYFVDYVTLNKDVETANLTKNSSIVSKTKMFSILANANQNELYVFAMAENYDVDSKGYVYKVLQLDKNVVNHGDKIFNPTYPGKKKKDDGGSSGGGGGSQERIANLDKLIEKENGLKGSTDVSTSGIWQKTPSNTYIYIDEKGEIVKSKWKAIAWKTWKDVPNSSAYDWYYFDENGNMKTGWFMDKDSFIYYFDTQKENEGAMLVGKHLINGIYYYFSDGTTGLPKGALDMSKPFGY